MKKSEIIVIEQELQAAFTAACKAIIDGLGYLKIAGIKPAADVVIEEEDYWAPRRLYITHNKITYNFHPRVGLKRVNSWKEDVNVVTLKAALQAADETLKTIEDQISSIKIEVEIPHTIKILMAAR